MCTQSLKNNKTTVKTPHTVTADGRWIEDARVLLGQTVRTFCKEAGISPSTYGKVRVGKKWPSSVTAEC